MRTQKRVAPVWRKSGRIVGDSMDSRMNSALAVPAPKNLEPECLPQGRWRTRLEAPSSSLDGLDDMR